jgi:hypothetical protein
MIRRLLLPAVYLITLGALAWLSYSFVDPNLTLINQSWFIAWQAGRWQLAAEPMRLGQWFLVATSAVVAGYFGLLAGLKNRRNLTPRSIGIWHGLSGLILLLGYNAYSHDIFNYLFNAKMVLRYQANPHVRVALDFPADLWLRFMHNVHTPAPYGYGWTLLSLLPFSLGLGKFFSAYLAMKLFMAAGLGLYLYFIWKLLELEKIKSAGYRFAMLAFHPLLLIETLMNGHNDVWMMWPALAGLYWLRRRKSMVLAGVGLAFSIFTKFATVLLLPVMLIELTFLRRLKQLDWWRGHWAELSALALLAPLLTTRSQQFHPWYLIWSLSFLPLINWKWLRYGLMGLSISSLYRYLPWILEKFEYSSAVELNMRLITWSGLLVGLGFWFFGRVISSKR